MSANFDFSDFLKQTKNVKMFSMSREIGMIPGMNKVYEPMRFICSLKLTNQIWYTAEHENTSRHKQVTPAQIREAKKKTCIRTVDDQCNDSLIYFLPGAVPSDNMNILSCITHCVCEIYNIVKVHFDESPSVNFM